MTSLTHGSDGPMTQPRRSVLYSPADQKRYLNDAVETDADAFIFDLEDSVPPTERTAARRNVREALADLQEEREIAVRVNGTGTEAFTSDVAAALTAGADAIVVPMVQSAEDVRQAWTALVDRTGDPPHLRIVIETPRGIYNGPDIARACRETGVVSLTFGFADYCKALGTPGTPDRVRERLELLTVELSSLADIDPVASVHLEVDEAGVRRVAERAREIGFVGMEAIHPDQLGAITDVFTPDEQEIREARRLVDAFDAAETDSLLVDDVFLDRATVDRYRRLLARAPE